MKCEYCIVAHTAMAKKAGATQEEIKTAIMFYYFFISFCCWSGFFK